VPRPSLAKDGDLDLFEKARVFVLEIRCLGASTVKILRSPSIFEKVSPLESRVTSLGAGAGAFRFSPVLDPFALQIDSARQARQQ